MVVVHQVLREARGFGFEWMSYDHKFGFMRAQSNFITSHPLREINHLLTCIIQGRTDTVAPVARATVNFPSQSSIVVYRMVYLISRETVAAYSL